MIKYGIPKGIISRIIDRVNYKALYFYRFRPNPRSTQNSFASMCSINNDVSVCNFISSSVHGGMASCGFELLTMWPWSRQRNSMGKSVEGAYEDFTGK